MEETREAPGSALIRGLASCNTGIRSKSLKTFLTWLPSQTLISDDEMKKLWKSLFYCMWHCDKIENQTNLTNRLSSLLPSLPPSLSLSYFSHFLLTMRREWPGIDHLRLDKFYLLIRFFLRNLFVLLKKSNWDLVTLEGFVGVLEKLAFFVVDDDGSDSDKGLGNGVSYHIVSVFCDEIKPFLPLKLEVLNLLFRPLVVAMGRSENKVLVGKLKTHVFEYLLTNGKSLLGLKKSGEEIDEKDEVMLFGTIALAMGFSTRFYELGSAPDCVQGSRKVVFGLHEEFLKLEKEKSQLGIEFSLPDVNGDPNDDEVPQLIPINGDVHGAENGGKMNGDLESKVSKEKKSKKKKKKKNRVNDSTRASGSNTSSDTEMVNSNGDSLNVDQEDEIDELVFNDIVMSNLQKQFEKIAAESGLDGDGVTALDSPIIRVNGKASKKRKRSKSMANSETGSKQDEEEEFVPKTEEKSGKRVRFSMKNNLVWKPHSPLPPQSLRIPPSVTPRGSALKKGLSPGPIRDTTQEVKRANKKKASPMKKARKVKSISPAVKRGKKKKVMSMSA